MDQMKRLFVRCSMTCVASCALIVGLTGCQEKATSMRGEVSTDPLVVDSAMQQRQWEPTTAFYETGSTFNGTTGFAYEPIPGKPRFTYLYADIGTFVANFATSPYTLLVADGNASGAAKLPPSYTANPPMPPSMNAPAPSAPVEVIAPATQPG